MFFHIFDFLPNHQVFQKQIEFFWRKNIKLKIKKIDRQKKQKKGRGRCYKEIYS